MKTKTKTALKFKIGDLLLYKMGDMTVPPVYLILSLDQINRTYSILGWAVKLIFLECFQQFPLNTWKSAIFV